MAKESQILSQAELLKILRENDKKAVAARNARRARLRAEAAARRAKRGHL